MISLKKRDAPNQGILYTNCDIPAKLFFEMMHTGDYSIVGGEENYDLIFDEYVELDENKSVIAWFNKQIKVKLILLQISTIELYLRHISLTPLTDEERNLLIDELNSLKGIKINFSKDPNNIIFEIDRVQKSVLGILNNKLKMETSDEYKKAGKVKYQFLKDLVAIENILERNIDEDVSLRKYIFLKKSAKEKVDNIKKITSKNGK